MAIQRHACLIRPAVLYLLGAASGAFADALNAARGDAVTHHPPGSPHARAVATRYDKRGYVYLGTVTAAALAIWLRT
ncbi:hypothetical protein Shyd_94590 [Streptomyces hydrogenans]|uniref:Uncharacterized protein n=2 Tax=Streptomyces hydrogenans TaxID=1873719 RepID=A0ABQ3PSU1_9ACTN|nr:hypothetical protein GCM10018784_64460 [Streptomyces hydrogenans]GHI28088.1 hypothetical protein Shyd_94590 [Streptomyces hydrogenans]